MGCNARDKLRRNNHRNLRLIKHNLENLPAERFGIPTLPELTLKTSSDHHLVGDNGDQNRNPNPNFDETGWGYCTEDQLEELLLKNLEFLYNEAMSKLVALGYNEEVALKAILRNGHCYGSMDVLSNILHNSLAYLSSSNVNSEEAELVFADLRQLLEYSLAGMVCLLQQVRPQLSKGDAMWCLLMSDLHVGRASSMEIPVLPSSPNGDNSNSSNGENANNSLNGIAPGNCKFHGGWGFSSGACDFSVNGSFHSSFDASVVRDIECPKRFNLPPSLQSMLQRNVTAFAAGFRANAKTTVVRPQIFGRSSIGVTLEPGVAPEKSDGFRENVKHTMIRSFGRAVGVTFDPEEPQEKPEGVRRKPKPAAKRTVPNILRIHGKSTMEVKLEPDVLSDKSDGSRESQTLNVLNTVLCSLGDLSLDEKGQYGDSDQKNELIMNLANQIKDLEGQVKERKEWAHQKAVQAARKLSQDLTELKMLRMEREETQRLKKGKQTLEDTTMKRLQDMENALRKASGQVDRANAAVRRLETENAEIRAEMEASKLSASESVTTCLEVAKREKKCLKKLLAWEKQKTKLQEEIAAEKQKITQLQAQLSLIKETQKETEVNWRQELKAKEIAIAQVEEERRSKEAMEVSAKRQTEALRRKIELDFQRHKDDIQRLEQELSRLKASVESTQINCRTNAIGTGDTVNAKVPGELNKVQDPLDKEVDYDRECIICMKDEVSVVFLPCAHQVLCASCSQDYGKKGKANCPCCRVQIEQRICVYGASS
ncbi:Mnd1-interacting protein [Thalictrum thalictroides]|uniref:Mnd1-interacting protein n=1 Tax=Thalictrum thalictroides TaxID=46969 RepID=A0A7J6X705_THATH|nr:Mnd1-interacting protein [Thalictrum thalictroides]